MSQKTWTHVVGCPGIGKSIIVLAYVMHWIQREENKGKSLVYIHQNCISRNAFTIDSTGNCIKFKFAGDKEIFNFARSKSNSNYDMIVVDGTNSNLINNILPNISEKQHLIVCTSFQAIKLNSESYNFVKDHYQKFIMLSWTLEEYIDAKAMLLPKMSQDSSSSSSTYFTYSESDILEEISCRFYYGGGSVRNFLNNTEENKIFILDKLSFVNDPLAMLKGNIGDASQFAVNSLMAIYQHDKPSIIVSEFALKHLFNRCSMEFIRAARQIMGSNPSWQGWITELEVISMLESSMQIEAWDINDKYICFRRVKPIFEFYNENDLLTANSYSCGMWLLPLKWNQACFDLIQIASSHCIIVFQITNGVKHDYKLAHLIPIVKALKVYKVLFITLCRRYNFTQFQVGNTNGLEELVIALRDNYEQIGGTSELSHFEHKLMCYEAPIRTSRRSSVLINELLNPFRACFGRAR